MDLIQVRPEYLETYTQRLAEEIRRAAADDEHVVGLYATAEKDNPARIHTMGIFTDEEGYEAYVASPAYQAFCRDTQDMIVMQNHIEISVRINAKPTGRELIYGQFSLTEPVTIVILIVERSNVPQRTPEPRKWERLTGCLAMADCSIDICSATDRYN